MKTILATALAFFLSIPAFAYPEHNGNLSFAGGKFLAYLSWDQEPNDYGGEPIMRIEWRNGATHEVVDTGLPFEVSLWMPSMGHGSAPTQIQPAVNDRGQAITGTYQIKNMHFLMPGDWDIRVTLKYQDDTLETQAWSISTGDEGH